MGCPSTASPHLHPPKTGGGLVLYTLSQPSRSDSQDPTATLPSASTEHPWAQASHPAPKEGTWHVVPPPAVSPGHHWEAARPQPPRPWHSQVPPQAVPPQQEPSSQSIHPCSIAKAPPQCCFAPCPAVPTHSTPVSGAGPSLHPTFPPSPAARSSNGAAGPAPERMGKVMAIDPGQGTEQLPKGLGAEQPQPGGAENKGGIAARLGASLPPSLPKQRGVCMACRGDNSLSPSNRASPGMGAGDKRLGGSSCVNISLDSARSVTATTERLQRAALCPQNALCLQWVWDGTKPKRSQGPFCHSKGPDMQDQPPQTQTQVLALAHPISYYSWHQAKRDEQITARQRRCWKSR